MHLHSSYSLYLNTFMQNWQIDRKGRERENGKQETHNDFMCMLYALMYSKRSSLTQTFDDEQMNIEKKISIEDAEGGTSSNTYTLFKIRWIQKIKRKSRFVFIWSEINCVWLDVKPIYRCIHVVYRNYRNFESHLSAQQ